MPNANKLLEKLITSLFYPNTPSPLFIQAQTKYLKASSFQVPEIDIVLMNTSQKAFVMYKKLPNNDTFKKLTFVLLAISSKSPTIEEELKACLRQGALGIEVSYFNPSILPTLRDKVNYSVYNIIHTLYRHSLIYKQLKLESDAPTSITHKHFLDKAKTLLKEYESTVLDCELDFLSFYATMYILFKKIEALGATNDIFRNRLHLQGFTKPPVVFENVPASLNNPLLKGYETVVFKVYNDCSISYCTLGYFNDPFNEYFIKAHILDHGLIPPFISKKTAETIAYIGKYTAFLKSMHSNVSPSDEIIRKIDLSKRSADSHLNAALQNVNVNLKTYFFEKLKVIELLKYIHSTFLFGRVDFIENLFSSLKESRKGGKKNISNLLESCLSATFPNSSFNCLMDIYISEEEKMSEVQPEGFSLYIKVVYPVSLLIEEDFVVKLVYVFKFLWKLKKIDHLSRRIGNKKYILLAQKLMFYAFQEVISAFNPPECNTDNYLFDEFKKDINRWMDRIMKGLFINTKGKKIEHLLFNLEKSLLAAGINKVLDEASIIKSLTEFYEFSKDVLASTCLFDLVTFVTFPLNVPITQLKS